MSYLKFNDAKAFKIKTHNINHLKIPFLLIKHQINNLKKNNPKTFNESVEKEYHNNCFTE